MVGRLHEKVALVVGAGSVGRVGETVRQQQSYSPARVQRYCAPM